MVNSGDERLDDIFHGLADPTRRAIVGLLAQQPQTVGELAAPFDISLVAVTKHLKTLERAGLVTREVRGRTHLMRLEAKALQSAHEWLAGYQQFWSERLNALESLLNEYHRK
jgi:DNA-binding transcriptional ArsR family regulator